MLSSSFLLFSPTLFVNGDRILSFVEASAMLQQTDDLLLQTDEKGDRIKVTTRIQTTKKIVCSNASSWAFFLYVLPSCLNWLLANTVQPTK